MKISNFKIMLLLVLGAFTLTLPNYACAQEKSLSAEKQKWLDGGIANGTIRKGSANDINNKIAALEEQYKPLKDKYWDAKKRFTLEVARWEFENLKNAKDEKQTLAQLQEDLAAPNSILEKGWAVFKASLRFQFKRTTRIMSMGWEYIEAMFTSDKGDSGEDALKEIEENYGSNKTLREIAKEMIAFGKQAYEIQLQKQTYAELHGGELYIYKETYIDANGMEVTKEIFFQKNDDTFITVGGVAVGCIPLPVKLAELRNCIFCPLFKTIFNASQVVSTNAFKHLGKSMAQIMLIGYALFVAFSVLKLVSAFTKQDAPKFITSLLSQTFKVLFAYILLMKSGEVYEYVIAPVLSAGLEFGMSLLFEKGDTYVEGCRGFSGAAIDGILPQYLYTKLDCFIRAVQAEISVPQSIGSTLMCVARNASATKTDFVITTVTIWDFSMMFQGLIIFCFAWLISLAFAFYLIDATVRLGIVGALMPFLIACWPFKITSSYTSKGWKMFMNSFFTFVMMGLVISINVQLMGQALTGSKGGFDAIKMAVNGDKVSELRELLDIGFSGFLILIACCIFGFKLTGQATELAGTMAGGGGGSNIGAGIGGLAASGATAVGKAGFNAGKGTVSAIGKRTGVTAGLNKMKDSAINGVARGASKLFGVGKSSGAAGGGSKPSTPKPSSPTQAQNNQQAPGATPHPSAQQTQKAQEAAPRNGGNGNEEKKEVTGGSVTPSNKAPVNSAPKPTGGSTPTANQSQGGDTNNPNTPINRDNLSDNDKKSFDKAQQYIAESQRSGSMSPANSQAEANRRLDSVLNKVKDAEAKGISNADIKGEGYSYKTDAVGQADFSKNHSVQQDKLSEKDNTLYNAIKARNPDGNGSLDVDGTFIMAKNWESNGGNAFDFAKKDNK